MFLILWLPLQTAGAVVMPFCQHALAGQSSGASQHQTHGANQAAAGQDEATATPAAGCDGCGLCHLACAGCLPAASGGPAHFAGHSLVATPAATLPSPPLVPRDRPPIPMPA
ncbi:MAG: hypothetical protein AB1768_06455 [Pseudomonadota bacterium]